MINFEYNTFETYETYEQNFKINGYNEFLNHLNSETEIVKRETTIEEDHNLNVEHNNTEHAIVVEIDNFVDQNFNFYFPPDENEDEEKNNCFDENEFEEEKKANVEIIFSDFFEFVESDELRARTKD